jgi:hypothetical protein
VAGIVLVDSGLVIPEQFANQSEFDQWKASTDALQLLLWGGFRTGLVRLTGSRNFIEWGYPAEIIPEMVALHSTNRTFDTTYAEQVPAMWALTQASAATKNLGDRSMAILWASETNNMMSHIAVLGKLRDEIASYSSNSVTQAIEGADHGSILGNELYAQQVSNAVLNVIKAIQTGAELAY